MAPDRPKKSILAIFTTTGWKSGSRGLSGGFSEWSRVSISIFSGRFGIRERWELWLGSSVATPKKPQNAPGKVNSRRDTDPATLPARVRTIFWVNHVHYCCLSPGKSILPGLFLVCISFASLGFSDSPRALPDPQPTRKNRNRDSGPLRNLSRKPPGSRLPPRGRENRQNRFFGAILGQKRSQNGL